MIEENWDNYEEKDQYGRYDGIWWMADSVDETWWVVGMVDDGHGG
jgi:hypothetical protein